MNTKRILSAGLLPFLIFTGCGKQTQVIEKVVERVVEVKSNDDVSSNSNNQNTSIIKTEASIVFKKMRKTKMDIDDRGNIKNFEQYMRDFNKRKIVVVNEGRFLDKGVLRCSDLTDPTNVIEKQVKFKDDGTRAEMELMLSNSNTTTHRYDCAVYENNNFLDKSKIELVFYSDIEVSTAKKYNEVGLVLKTLNNVGALVLLENSSIVSDGENVQIRAEEIIARPGSKIKSFLESEYVSQGNKNGKSGGFFDIKTEFITGTLKVEMRGQDGGKVVGRPAKITSYPSFYVEGMLDGIAESWHNVPEVCDEDGHRCYDPSPYIDVSATSGKNGFQGLRGAFGYPGFKGGDTGIFKLTANQTSSFLIDVSLIPGLGSSGSEGGEGGPGTPGGKINCSQYCSGITAGKAGENGLIGEVGVRGLDGVVKYGQFIHLGDPLQNKDFNSDEREQ